MRRSTILLVAGLFATTSCQEADAPEPTAPSPLALASGFVETGCPTASVYKGPAPGTRITSTLVSDSGRAQRQAIIVFADGARTGFQSELQGEGLSSPVMLPAINVVQLGLLRGGQVDAKGKPVRSYVYDGDPAAALSALEVGQTIDLPVVETEAEGDLSTRHIFEITLVACGRLPGKWANVPVRVYRTVFFNRNRAPAAGSSDPAVRSVTLNYMSDEHGWYLRRQTTDGGYEVVEEFARS